MLDYGIIEREVIVNMLLCYMILAATRLTADHRYQVWEEFLMDFFDRLLTTILSLYIYI